MKKQFLNLEEVQKNEALIEELQKKEQLDVNGGLLLTLPILGVIFLPVILPTPGMVAI